MKYKTLILLVTIGFVAGCGSEKFTQLPDGEEDTDDDVGNEGMEAYDLPEGCFPEECNGIDDDCDGEIDEDFDLFTDPDHCGACNFPCEIANGTPSCEDGLCLISDCDYGYFDIDGNPYNGCEYACVADVLHESDDDGTCSDGLDNDCDGRIDEDDPDCSECVPEFCNGEDDDCDTLIDEDFDLRSDYLNCGSCGNICPTRPNASPICILGECYIQCDPGFSDVNGDVMDGCEGTCEPTADPSEFACDGLDNDCDGQKDEDYVPYLCGIGACETNSVCLLGEEVCVPLEPESVMDALCDGIDNDCDGLVDEDFEPVNCLGACVEGALCESGVEICGPRAEETDVTCDGIDGDCDGEVDEDWVSSICGIGVCENQSTCNGMESCEILLPRSPDDMTCDNMDDNCNGSTDEDYVPYQCGVGLCVNNSVCVSGVESCTPLDPPVDRDFNCDNQDEDCDGAVDDDYRPYTCGQGVCQRDSTCVGGVENCSPGSPTGSDSNCNGIDENCNGLDDDNYSPYQCGIGVCRRDSTCIGGSESCTPGSPTGDDSDCDGRDDDCDGSNDEHYAPYTCGLGPCQRTSTCVGGVENCTPGPSSPEQCDGIDNDCDGTIDDGMEDSYESNETCGNYANLGTVSDNPASTITVNGTLLPSSDDDWYRVRATDDSDTAGDEFNFEVYWVTRPSAVVFDVYKGNCSTLICSGITDCANQYYDFRSGSGTSAVGENPCSTTSQPNKNICSNDTAYYYIHVYRTSGSANCVEYRLRIRNNPSSPGTGCAHP